MEHLGCPTCRKQGDGVKQEGREGLAKRGVSVLPCGLSWRVGPETLNQVSRSLTARHTRTRTPQSPPYDIAEAVESRAAKLVGACRGMRPALAKI